MQLNSLRTKSGKFELGARIFATGFFTTVWLGVGIGCGVLAHQITSDRQLIFLPALLWPVFLMWQVVPVMLSTAQESVDFNFLLRFPVSFRSYSLIYLFFGLFDPSSLLGGMCMLGIWVGVMTANPGLDALDNGGAVALRALQFSAHADDFRVDRALAGAAEDAGDFGDRHPICFPVFPVP